jgi:hypothetical protein
MTPVEEDLEQVAVCTLGDLSSRGQGNPDQLPISPTPSKVLYRKPTARWQARGASHDMQDYIPR